MFKLFIVHAALDASSGRGNKQYKIRN